MWERGSGSAAAQSRGASRQAGRDGKTILICEDEASLRELVRAVLGPGYRYAEAADGDEALELIRTVAPDLVILDLMLPQVTGFEVLEAIRGDAAIEKMPVVVITAWSHVEAAAQEAGADRFVAKPFEPSELQAAVHELLGES
jgi:two-component system phosphate regulon response regulator PhoB